MNVYINLLKSSENIEKKAPVIGIDGSQISEVVLPKVFYAPLREDVVRRAYIHLQTHKLQPKGSFKGSGHKYSVESWGAGYGMARISRIKASGTGKTQSGGMVPSAVGGRPTHPPTVEKKIYKELNKKEKNIALIVAVAYTSLKDAVLKRGHRIPENMVLPIVVDNKIEGIAKTRELKEFLDKIGLREELERCREKKIRAGKGKRRGRRYKKKIGPLIVIYEDRGVTDAVKNIPGVEVVKLKDLSVLHLAPGAKPGRLTLYTLNAFEKLDEVLLGGLR
ncbi:MAG: 50S ribosomal protein L4 [Aigarchaeota archaeon]|nr:50S ribosomal protein L4 [Aigarchaeota archaeon]MCX8193158.1 50S ribosomal protein L4 [Nitrososphaeria archaeon]